MTDLSRRAKVQWLLADNKTFFIQQKQQLQERYNNGRRQYNYKQPNCQKFLIIFFINVAKDIGSSNIKSDESHPSISKIIANTPDIENLVFHDIKEDFIIKQINKINKKQQDEMASRLKFWKLRNQLLQNLSLN